METSDFSVLIDADALVALAKPDDKHHATATMLYEWLKSKNADLFISNFTVPETGTVLSNRVSHAGAKKFISSAVNIGCTEIELNREFARKAVEWFNKQRESRGVSYFDCVNLALMDAFKFDAIFSFDHIYADNGFKLVSDLAGK